VIVVYEFVGGGDEKRTAGREKSCLN